IEPAPAASPKTTAPNPHRRASDQEVPPEFLQGYQRPRPRRSAEMADVETAEIHPRRPPAGASPDALDVETETPVPMDLPPSADAASEYPGTSSWESAEEMQAPLLEP